MEGQEWGLSSLVRSTWKDLNLPGRWAWELGHQWTAMRWEGLSVVGGALHYLGTWTIQVEKGRWSAGCTHCCLLPDCECKAASCFKFLPAWLPCVETILLNGEPGLPPFLEVALLRVFFHGHRNVTKLVPILIPCSIFLQSFAGTGVPMFYLEPVNLFEYHLLTTSHEAGIPQSLS